MRLEHLQYLIEIGECQSISKAAQRLYVTQPALSIMVNDFEKRLGVTLFKRSKQGAIPTAHGQRLISDARRILDTIQSWYNWADDEKEISGDIHIVAVPAICSAIMSDVIMDFKHLHPNATINLHEVRAPEILQYMQNNFANIGIMIQFDDTNDALAFGSTSKWNTCKLFDDDFIGLISTENPHANQDKLTRDDVLNMPLASYTDRNDPITQKFLELFPEIKDLFLLNSSDNISQIVARNTAFSICPRATLINNHLAMDGKIKAIPIEGLHLQISYHMVYSDNTALSQGEQVFINFLKAYCLELFRLSRD